MQRSGKAAEAVLVSALSLLLLVYALSLWGCGKVEPAQEGENREEAVPGEDAVAVESVTLKLYFRRSVGTQEWLYPEDRTVNGASDPCLAAMEQLIRGPAEGSQLHAVLPDTVKVLDIEAAGGVCTVDLSSEVLTDANQVGVSASSEGLALAAIANTLTELAGVEKVRLLVEGMQSGLLEGRFVEDFWGHTGLPEYLERDEDVIYKEPG